MLECWLLEHALSILQVLGATLDRNAVNKRLIKLHVHGPSSDLVYKGRNPYTQKEHDLSFPPHLVKIIQNCWQSKHRVLWIRLCNLGGVL